jgi:putative SOS response-associated peptidase YedK
MCGRFTLFSDGTELARLFGCGYDKPLSPRYNIASGQPVTVVRHVEGEGPPVRHLVMVRWGLIPSWAKDARIAYQCINAQCCPGP